MVEIVDGRGPDAVQMPIWLFLQSGQKWYQGPQAPIIAFSDGVGVGAGPLVPKKPKC
jgi:hypothetical protein